MTKESVIFGQNLKRLRTEGEFSQQQLASRLGVNKSYISRLENGNKNPTLITLSKIAQVLGVKVVELLE